MEQCLHSVLCASALLEVDIIVVDNHSTDNSLAYLKPKFPQVRFISNETNSGFGRACNRGLQEARGSFVLFLNPDTLVAEDSFTQCIRFFEEHPDCGAVGVKMIDGSGAFLKESKRAFPSPLTSLFKLTGLAYLFPKSKLFSRYHLGHLSRHQVHEVDVLAGAFLLTKKEVLQKTGGAFDEDFFMYGEDVDLSYRIQKAGFKNYYFPHTAIIHFKGESTKRGSLNYVRMFYQAMIIFVRKHYGGARAGVFTFSIQAAIWLRALLSVVLKLVQWIGRPVMDAVIILLSFYLVKEAWERYVRPDIVYPKELLLAFFPLLTLTYLVAAYYAGLYDKTYRLRSLARSTFIATIALLTLYALLPEHLRFSRGIVVLGAVTAFVVIVLQRWLLVKGGLLPKPQEASQKPHMLVAANGKEFAGVKKFMAEKRLAGRILGRVSSNGSTDGAVASLDELTETAKALNARDLLFCAGTLSYKTIIQSAEKFSSLALNFRYHASGSSSIVGSDSSTGSGEILSEEILFNLARASNKRLKRLVDVVAAGLLLLSFPIHLFFVKKYGRFLANGIAVLVGSKTWVGYGSGSGELPPLRKGILAPNGVRAGKIKQGESKAALIDYWYARNYEPVQDVKTILQHYPFLGGE